MGRFVNLIAMGNLGGCLFVLILFALFCIYCNSLFTWRVFSTPTLAAWTAQD